MLLTTDVCNNSEPFSMGLILGGNTFEETTVVPRAFSVVICSPKTIAQHALKLYAATSTQFVRLIHLEK